MALTMGDPAGIGSEVIVKAYPAVADEVRPVVLGDYAVLAEAVEACRGDLQLRAIESVDAARFEPGVLDVVDFENVPDHAWGEHRAEYGRAGLAYVEHAIDLAMAGAVDAMATAPLNKRALELAGSDYAGHTNLLADRTGTDEYAMLLVQGDLRVTHVTVHVSLWTALESLTTERVLETIAVTDRGLRGLGIGDPSIAVAGVNPHAGEAGLMGDADVDIVEPAVERARAADIDASGPWPPDNVFNQAAVGRFDAVVAMYHDQGHIAANMHGLLPSGGIAGFNMTIGLPITRTSTIHGTAFDIAGTGAADPDGMVDAVRGAALAVDAGTDSGG